MKDIQELLVHVRHHGGRGNFFRVLTDEEILYPGGVGFFAVAVCDLYPVYV